MKNFVDEQLQIALGQYPDRVALDTGASSYTYAQLAFLIPRIATRLQSEGITRISRVGIDQNSSIDFLLSWSLLWLGVAGCSIQKGTTVKRGDYGIDWLLSETAAPWFESAVSDGTKSQNVVVDRLWLMEAEALSEPMYAPELDESAIARLAMTSGSTGDPKCASFGFDFLANRAKGKSMAWNHRVRGSFFGPTIWVGFSRLLSSFSEGATIHLLTVNSPERLVKSVELGLEEISGSPAQYVSLLQTVGPLAPRFWNLKILRVSGGLLTKQLKERLFDAFGCDIEVRYSSTETGNVASAVINRSGPDYFVGTLAAQGTAEVVDESGLPLQPGQRGQVRIKKQSMVTNYLTRSGEVIPALASNWFYPGDEGALTAAGELFIYGRTGQVKNFGGVKIDLAKVEEFFNSEPGVTGCAALSGFNDSLGVERVVVALEVSEAFDRSTAIEKAKAQFFFSSILDILEFKEFPRSEMGKIQKEALASSIKKSAKDSRQPA
jgi:acyl-coenzyme A synthetase/AMP-(fatty) acid ligase